MNVNVEKLNSSESESLLKELKLFSSLRKQLWRRWEVLFNEMKTWKKSFEVEYFSGIGENIAWEEAQKWFEKVFKEKPSKEEVFFKQKDTLKWWIKLYVWSNVLDLSYDRIEKAIRK